MVKNKETWLALIVAEAIFWIPVWIPFVLGIVLQNPWFYTISTAAIVFWAGPFTPAIALQIALALFIAKLMNKKKKLKKENNHNNVHTQ